MNQYGTLLAKLAAEGGPEYETLSRVVCVDCSTPFEGIAEFDTRCPDCEIIRFDEFVNEAQAGCI